MNLRDLLLEAEASTSDKDPKKKPWQKPPFWEKDKPKKEKPAIKRAEPAKPKMVKHPKGGEREAPEDNITYGPESMTKQDIATQLSKDPAHGPIVTSTVHGDEYRAMIKFAKRYLQPGGFLYDDFQDVYGRKPSKADVIRISKSPWFRNTVSQLVKGIYKDYEDMKDYLKTKGESIASSMPSMKEMVSEVEEKKSDNVEKLKKMFSLEMKKHLQPSEQVHVEFLERLALANLEQVGIKNLVKALSTHLRSGESEEEESQEEMFLRSSDPKAVGQAI